MTTKTTLSTKVLSAYARSSETEQTIVDDSILDPQMSSVTYGDNYPDWRQRIRDGSQATTILTGEKLTSTHRQGILYAPFGITANQAYRETEGNVFQGIYFPWQSVDADHVPSGLLLEANNVAKSAFLKKLNDFERSFQGGVFLGELRETLHMIKNPAAGLRRGLDDYISRVKKLWRRPRNRKGSWLADTWLEYSFGWAPLINDINEGADALAELHHRKFTQRLTAVGKSEGVADGYDVAKAIGKCWPTFHYDRKHSAKVVYRGAVAAEPDSRSLAQHFGLSPGDFAPTVWELLPWSFLIDYFTNIGDVISGWSTGLAGLNWASRTDRVQEQINLTSVGVNENAYSSYILYGYLKEPSWTSLPLAKKTSTKIARAPYVGGFTPDFRWEFPELLSKKWLNIAALTVSRRVNSRGSLSIPLIPSKD